MATPTSGAIGLDPSSSSSNILSPSSISPSLDAPLDSTPQPTPSIGEASLGLSEEDLQVLFGTTKEDLDAALNCSGHRLHQLVELFASPTAEALSTSNVTTTAPTTNNNGSWPISAVDLLSEPTGSDNSSSLATLLNTKGPSLDSLLDLLEGRNSASSYSHCPSRWYGLSCWNRTAAGQESVISCPSVLNGIYYDTTQNASRHCLPNGTWAEKANYDRCLPITDMEASLPSLEQHLYASYIFYFGYILSLCALIVALFILLYFKDLRCVRNTIHTNLMTTYLLIAIFWIIMDQLHSNPSQISRNISCYLEIGFRYLVATNFFWMFVEGLYLYLLVVKTFSIDMIRSAYYYIIGWGLPAIVITIWALTKKQFTRNDSMISEARNATATPPPPHRLISPLDQIKLRCPFQTTDEYDYFYKVPVLFVLFVNIFFLGKIMWLLIVKLRSVQQNQSAESKQYHKAAKALLVLIPLLGVGYMLLLVTPTQETWRVVFKIAQAVLTSTQGFTVAVLYCFCNGEVRNSVRNHFERYRLRRTLRYGGDYPTPSASNNLYWRPHNYHHTHATSNGSNGSANHRKHYTFKSLKTSTGQGSNGTRKGNSAAAYIKGGAGTRELTGNGTTNRKASSTGTNGSTPSRGGPRFSNASESAITSARLYSSGRPNRARGDSCVSFTTTSSYVILASGGSGGPSGTATLVGTGNGQVGASPKTVIDFGNGIGRGCGYQSVPTTPEEEQINIELQPV